MREWLKSGVPWVWLNAGALGLSLVAVLGLLLLIAVRGMGHFWPATVEELRYADANGREITLIGEFHDAEEVTAARLRAAGQTIPEDLTLVTRYLFKTGNRDVYGADFRWIIDPNIKTRSTPEDLVVLERHEWGNFYGRLKAIKEAGKTVSRGEGAWEAFLPRLQRAVALHNEIKALEKDDIGAINHEIERLRLAERRLQLEEMTPGDDPEAYREIEDERRALGEAYKQLNEKLVALRRQSERDSIVLKIQDGGEREINLSQIVIAFQPNAMSTVDKLGHYFAKVWEFVSDEPREANTEGGVFPAIFGTVMMVLLMAVIVTPFGVVAALYLREYAKQGLLVRTIRIAVNNLAGVPSIVYGVFGLGFFVYFLGGNIDSLFFPEAYPAPTFGSPGILWSALTLAILTLPVVIVSTEEGLSRIPRALREGSLALGATKIETLWKVVLPMASPAMMTGLILAVARAAGEVAPLMLVGVVKLAPTLPVDGHFPFLHLERKFMHLGFHIYDVGFQSPNVEAARPLVYATALLLILVIIVLNLFAIQIRNRLREKYRAFEH